jgi:lysophospholipase L1-like esterase
MSTSSSSARVWSAARIVIVNIAILVTSLAFIELFAFLFRAVPRWLPSSDPAAAEARDANPEIFPDQSWLTEFFREQSAQQTEWTPYTYWRRRPFDGKYVTVDERGQRVTWNSQANGASNRPRKQVWMFGGSSIWGTGARNEHTIPSRLSQILAEHYPGIFEVSNMGETGYVNTQEVITLLKEVQSGRTPDIAIFYDGFNDAFALLQSGREGMPQNEWNRAREFNLLHPSRSSDLLGEALKRSNTFTLARDLQHRLFSAQGPPALIPAAGEERRIVPGLIRAYVANMDAVGGLADRRGFQYRFFWQASVFSKGVQSDYEQRFASSNAEVGAFMVMVNTEIASSADLARRADFRNALDLFGTHSGTVFIDGVHASEAGNDRIARWIFEDSRDLFAQAAPQVP